MDAFYCFCFAPACLASDLRFDDCGWEDPIEIRRLAGLDVILSRVPLGRFAGAEAEQRLADLEWLVPRAQAHDRVITRTMERSTVFPLTFATLFSSLPALALEVAARRRALLDFFERMAGREEWAVKVSMDRERVIATRMQSLYPEGGDVPAGGRGYLLKQRRRGEAEQAIGPWLKGQIGCLDEALRPSCETLLIRPLRDEMVASRACLVARDLGPSLSEAIERSREAFADQGLDLHCSGPWPLYSFCGTP
ncbi:GvpL/GvpF family gas vesicle protein [Thiocapsa rosea]|uniref:Gas vesicle protein GvpL/GvpF n=1 Tax=Thiocapsa rosea TaxID=69360 RepID=A0A495VBF7_9GAMM|nr:GvpL/GvpF family gas vesicle protein [Thiocapsa rosea]RKT46110.1 gas vesicle protein GvpL/GvpF [Thiocapsa rosea]